MTPFAVGGRAGHDHAPVIPPLATPGTDQEDHARDGGDQKLRVRETVDTKMDGAEALRQIEEGV